MVPGVLLLLMMLQVERMVPGMAERILMMWKQLRKSSSGHGRRQLRVIGSVGSAPPINEQSILAQLTHSALKGDDVPGIELLFLDEAAPAFGHHVTLAAVPVGVPESPRLPISVFEIQEESLLVGGGVEREILLRVLLGDD